VWGTWTSPSRSSEPRAAQRLTVSLRIVGRPVGKGRPRFTRSGRAYTPKTTREWERTVADQAALQYKGEPLGGAVHLAMVILMPRPKSAPKRVTRHVKKPDVDNLVKSVLDGLVTAGVITDDNVVDSLVAVKRYAEPGHEGVRVLAYGDSDANEAGSICADTFGIESFVDSLFAPA
jgi:Holliday junction resolvase RusA-like endonuclease